MTDTRHQNSAMGRLSIVGLGPGNPRMMVPAAKEALEAATHIIGYETYVRMAGPFRTDQNVMGSDNRVELDRARDALNLALNGSRVVIVSSGDPGIFAMASAVFEVLDRADNPAWRNIPVEVIAGISAAQAAAAKAGAPLGHDFCTISLSDNLKPWDVIENRLQHAASADFVLALYNPVSKARPWQLSRALEILRGIRHPQTPVILGRDVDREGEIMTMTTLATLHPEHVDSRTVVIIGSSTTRIIPRFDGGAWVYTPRFYNPVVADEKKVMGE